MNEKDHYVIVNWNDKGGGIVEQLRNPDVEKRPIVIVTSAEKESQSLDDHARAIHHVRQGALGEALLRSAGVQRARSIIVLADPTKKPHEADTDTVLIILALRKIFEAEKVRVPIVAEILAPEQVQLAKFVGAWGDGDVEIVSSSYLAQNLLAQVAVTPGLTKVYEDLLTFGKATNEIYQITMPPGHEEMSFGELLQKAADLRSRNINVIPVAVRRGEEVHVNPTPTKVARLQPGDILYAICDKKSDLEHLLQ